ncbi:MAG: hypothetical protein AAGA03_12925 [Planctomycetota bacterium]
MNNIAFIALIMALPWVCGCRVEPSESDREEWAPNTAWQQVLGCRWALAELRVDGATEKPPAQSECWIEFNHDLASAGTITEHTYQGQVACREFSGIVALSSQSDQVMILSDIFVFASDECEKTKWDEQFIRAVDRTMSFQVNSDRLTLDAPSQNMQAIFVRQSRAVDRL